MRPSARPSLATRTLPTRFVLCVLFALGIAATVHAADNPTVPATVPAVTGSNACERMSTPNLVDAQGARVDFARIPDAPSHLVSAKVVNPGNDVKPFCLITGYVSPNVGFELRLPMADWNGKFSMVGCGGMCGGIQEPGCDVPLLKGYACIMTDMGHRGTQIDAEWAYNNLQAEVDFGYRATHVTTLAGKYMTQVFYGQAPGTAYFLGCSTGGRQGLVEAQRFPDDYDGILAGSPPMNELGDGLDIAWSIQALENADGTPLLKSTDLALVTKTVLAQCDLADGVKDGVVTDPRSCRFDPGTLVCRPGQTQDCLQPRQAEALKKVYAGPHDSKGRRWYFGVMPGSEPVWVNSLQRDDGQVSVYKAYMNSQFRFLSFWPDPGPAWTLNQIDWDRDPKRLGMMEALFNAQNPDLRAFKATGGKMISFHGWNDHIVQPEATADYYETVERVMGGRPQTQDFFRLFMAPGVNHCQSGSGAYAVDWFGALENWVERGKAPDRIVAARPVDPKGGLYPRFFTPAPGVMENPIYSRPLFPYPMKAVYGGSGDTNDQANFKAVK